MRGKRFCHSFFLPSLRITPADAGKTVQAGSSLAKNEDHPRGCGENSPITKNYIAVLGSPPRMRGKHI